MAEQENINAQGEINAHVANRLAALEQQLADTEEVLEQLNKAAGHLAELLQLQYSWKARIEELEHQVKDLQAQIETLDDNTPGINHYHDEYASIDHVERSESSFRLEFSRLQNSMDNLEYRVNDVEHKAENAQRSADAAQRSSHGGW